MAVKIDGGGKDPRSPESQMYGALLARGSDWMGTPAAGGASANPFPPGTWEYEFFAAHGRSPTDQDRQDRAWGDAFYREHGRPPTQADWQRRWYELRSSGPAGGDDDEVGVTMGEIFRMLELPATTAEIPSYARPWFSYVTELLRGNSMFAIPVPAIFEDIEQPEEETTPAYMEDAETFSAKWQQFLSKLEGLDIHEQQKLVGWRYTPEIGWARGDAAMLKHPGYL